MRKIAAALTAILAAAAFGAAGTGAGLALAAPAPAGCTVTPAAPAAGQQFTVAFNINGGTFNVAVTDTDGTAYSSDLYNYASGVLTAGWNAANPGTAAFTVTRVPGGKVAGYCQVPVS
jgi:hypothetical protein